MLIYIESHLSHQTL